MSRQNLTNGTELCEICLMVLPSSVSFINIKFCCTFSNE